MRSRPTVLVLVWLVGAAVATSVGLLAVSLVASQVGDPAVPPVSAQRATEGSPRPSTASPTVVAPSVAAPSVAAPSPAQAPPSASRTFRSQGGTVAAQCSGTVPRMVYATPADGYALDERSVEGSELEVRFEAGETRAKLTISCASGSPVLVDEDVDDD